MGDDTVKAIERRWSTTHDRGAHDYTDEGCRILAEGAFKDVRILLSALVAAEAERDRLQHFVDCADTPLMRDVMAARDKAEAELDEMKRAYMEQRGMREESDMRLMAAEARVTALTVTVVARIRIASQYLDTDRGDLDGWVEAARAALAPKEHA